MAGRPFKNANLATIRLAVHLVLILVQVVMASLTIAGRKVLPQVPAPVLVMLRVGGAAVLLVFVHRLSRRPYDRRRGLAHTDWRARHAASRAGRHYYVRRFGVGDLGREGNATRSRTWFWGVNRLLSILRRHPTSPWHREAVVLSLRGLQAQKRIVLA